MEAPEVHSEPTPDLTPAADDVPWGVLLALTVLLVCHVLQIFAAGIVSIVSSLLDAEGAADIDARLVAMGWSATISSALTVCVLAMLLMHCPRGRSWVDVLRLGLPEGRWLRQSALCMGAGLFAYVCLLVAQAAYSQAFDYTPLPQPTVILMSQARNPGALAMMFLAVVILAPVFEEILFRCVLYVPLRRELGIVPAALIVAAIFSSLHFYVWGALQLVVLSLIFTALRERTKSLWPPILLHALNNGLTFVLVLYGDM